MKLQVRAKMRYLICSAALCMMVTQGVWAENLQLTAGTLFFGGSAGISYQSNNITKVGTLTAGVDLPFGYFVMDKLVFGFNLKTSVGLIDSLNQAAIGLGPLLAYFFETGSIIYPFVSGKLLLNWSKFNPGTQDVNKWRFVLAPEIGIFVALTKNAALGISVEGDFSLPISIPKLYGFNGTVSMIGVRAFF